MVDIVLTPVVWRPRKSLVDGVHIPLQMFVRLLMFVNTAQSVSEFVHHDSLVFLIVGIGLQPSEVHRRLILREVVGDQTVGSNGRPRPRIRLKRDADFGIGIISKVELNVSVVFPLARIVLALLTLYIVSIQKAAAQSVSIVPLLLDNERHPRHGDWMVRV